MMTTTNRNGKRLIWTTALALSAAAVIGGGGGGCKSSDQQHDVQVDQSIDHREQNRMLVRWTLAENVYNGVAAERAVYPKDFDPGTAVLNRLGVQRAQILADASRNSTAPIVVLRGDAPDELFDARIAAVRQELIAAGLKAEQITLAKDIPVGGGALPSDRALLQYQRLISDYLPRQQSQGSSTDDNGIGMVNRPTASNSSNSSSN